MGGNSMAVIRWDPFRDLNSLQERMNRLFEEANRGWRADDPSSTTSWSPAVDIYESDSDIVVKAELPGMEREDIDLNLENNVLTLKGNRRFERDAKDENYHRIERAYGTFSRSFSIPAVVEEGSIRAEYKQGVLTIVLPKTQKAKPQQIKIES
jgi:HSP20 family protein